MDTIPPVANAGIDRSINEDALFTFNGSASTDNVDIIDYIWTFVDVSSKVLIGIASTYVFETPGIYAVTLNVSDNVGNWDTDNVTITVLDITMPEANMTITPGIGVVVGATITFDASESRDNIDVVSCEWDFGDGNTKSGMIVTHSYSGPGNYTVTLTVSDAAENTDICSASLQVSGVFPWWIIGVIVTVAVIIPLGILFWKRKAKPLNR